MAVIISKYIAYYTKTVPTELQNLVFSDRNILMVKEGLAEINGYKCPRLSLQVLTVNSRVDGQRIVALNNLLTSLIRNGSLEHFVKA